MAGQFGRTAISFEPHPEQIICFAVSGTGQRLPNLRVTELIGTTALWLHRLHQQ